LVAAPLVPPYIKFAGVAEIEQAVLADQRRATVANVLAVLCANRVGAILAGIVEPVFLQPWRRYGEYARSPAPALFPALYATTKSQFRT